MKRHSRLILLINLLVITSLACGLSAPAPTTAPTALPTQPLAAEASATPAAALPTATQVPATFTPLPPTDTPPPPSPTPDLAPTPVAPQAGQPLDGLDLYAYNLYTGEWTEGEGLAVLLGLLAGEVDPASVPFAADLESIDLTGLFRRVERYLAANDDPEVARLLDKLVIPDERFDLYSEPTDVLDEQSSLPHNARPVAPLSVAQSERCRELFAEGFPEDSARICFQYATFTHSGQDYRLYFPAGWAADPTHRALLSLALDALRHAVPVFNAYGPAPIMPTRVVFTELNLISRITPDGEIIRSTNIYAKAKRGGGATCRVGIPPAGYEGEGAPNANQLKQSIAHELFHCYQYTNLSDQESGPDPAANEWWVEGGAEFFSDVVYPEVQFETRWAGDLASLAASEPLYLWSYASYVFFEYLANHEGQSPEQIIAFMRRMPTSGGLPDQMDALTNTDGMQDTFHRFAQNFVKEAIRERSGSVIDTVIQPLEAPRLLPAGVGNTVLAIPPFRIGYYAVELERNLDYPLTVTTSGSQARLSSRPAQALEWMPLPEKLSSSCNSAAYHLLLTTTSALGHTATLAYETTESTFSCDECLVGLWSLDTASYLALVNYITPAESEAGMGGFSGVTGGLTMKLTDAGQFQAAFAPMTVNGFMLVDDGTSSDNFIKFLIDVIFSGTSSGTYSASEEIFTTAVTNNALNITFTINGQPGGRVSNAAMDPGAMLGGGQYICSATSLILQPPPPVQAVKADPPWLVFTKVP